MAKCGCGNSVSQCGQSCNSCCKEVVPACPTGFCAEPAICLEDHSKTIVKAAYALSAKIENAFNIPSCGMSAEVKISGLVSVAIGAYLWKQAFGYLQVVAFNAYEGKVTLQNNCNAGNAAPGTTVPACSLWVVTDPPVASPGSTPTGIFVAIDFTAPNVGDCLLITVTGVTGLATNKNVGIGSGIYRVNTIPDSTHIEICNDGAGITPGSAVIAKNGAGEYQYPIVLIDVNTCTNPAVPVGALLTCHDGIQQPLQALASGMVPVSTGTDNEFMAIHLDVPTRTCATITCCFTIIAGNAGPYIIPVSSSAEFVVGDILQIGTRTDRVTVTGIPDATHIIGTISPVPGASADIAFGTSICIIDCCEDLQNQIDVINDTLAAIPCSPLEMWLAAPDAVEVVSSVDVDINAGNPSASNPAGLATLSLTNASTCRNGVVTFYLEAKFVGDSSGGQIDLQFNMEITEDGGVPFSETFNQSYDENAPNDFVIFRTLTRVLPPGGTKQFDIGQDVSRLAGAGTYSVRDWLLRITAVGHT